MPRRSPLGAAAALILSSVATAPIAPLAGIVAAAGVAAAPPQAHAQAWASKMFDKLDHDFGVVARGSDTVYRFEIKNIYKEDVEIGGVRSSCGCTSPTLDGTKLKTYEKGYVVATFNTRTFTGIHSATLTVDIIKPYPAQVQLRVHGNIRGDVVFEPGSIDFDTVEQGSRHEKTVTIAYAGRSDWRVTDVRSVAGSLEAELIERGRVGGKVTYDLLVRLLETAPPGFLKEQVVLVTSDLSTPRIPIEVQGRVTPELSVSPENLVLGDVPAGQVVTKKLIVRGKKPFRITSADSSDERFQVEAVDREADRHIVSVRFTSGGEPGRLMAPIRVRTSLGDTYSTECKAYATVVASQPPAPAPAEGASAKTAQAP